VSATLQIQEAWERTVRRTVEVSGCVTGEARIRQALDDSVGMPALTALESLLDQGQAGWVEVEGGYRCNVEGGYVVYHLDDRTLEIVAALEDRISVAGEAADEVRGVLATELTAEGEGQYYDDNFGGRTEEDARRDAEAAAQRKLDEVRRAELLQAQDQAESAVAGRVEEAARRQGEAILAQQAAARQAELESQAGARLTTVGLRCRQQFHQLLGLAYRDAILAYARTNGAENIECSESGDVVEIEFLIER